MNYWTFFWCNLAAQTFEVDGILFEEEIFKRFRDTKMVVDVIEPIRGTNYKCRVYSCSDSGKALNIAYGEITPGVNVAFADGGTLPFCAPKYKWSGAWVRVD